MALPLLSLSLVCLSVCLSPLIAPSFGADTGKLSVTFDGLYEVEWSIGNFLSLPTTLNGGYPSPKFRFLNRDWRLWIYPNGYSAYNNSGWIGLRLTLSYNGPRTLKYKCSLKNVDGREVNPKYYTYSFNDSHNVAAAKFLERSELLSRKSELVPSDTLTVLFMLELGDRGSSKDIYSEKGKSSNEEMTVDTHSEERKCNNKEMSVDTHLEKGNCSNKEMAVGFDILQQQMRKFLLVGPGYDVIFKLIDGDIRAHKAVLMARSPVFASTFGGNKTEGHSGVIYIEDFKSEAFREFLLYLYCGKADNISLDNMFDLYKAAHKYDFPDLKSQSVQFMNTSLSVNSTSDVIRLAAKHNETELLETATDFLKKNIQDVLMTVEWKRFLQENPLAANELYIKALKTCYKTCG